MSLYTKNEWKEYSKGIIESDGSRCAICGRSNDEVILQVHHKKYIKNKLPWEYASKDCITICKGCHAAEHGIIKPKFGWEYIGDEDLEDLIGTCDHCGTSLRYVFYIFHRDWGTIKVGTLCCDNLTDTQIASNKRETLHRYKDRQARFLKSKRWKTESKTSKIRQNLFDVEITEENNSFSLTIHNIKGKNYNSLDEAKEAAFDVIESGKLIEYLDKYKIEYRKKTKKK
jgi:hypothetical protein